MKPIKYRRVNKYKESCWEIVETALPQEALFTLFLNDVEILTFLATPQKMRELAAGFLLAAGVLKRREKLQKILVNEKDGLIWVEAATSSETVKKLLNRRYLTSGCGGGGILEDPTGALQLAPVRSEKEISAAQAAAVMKNLLAQAELYQSAGGLHGAALAGPEKIFFLAEDIGRHNAVDKVLGASWLSGLNAEDKIIAVTGRISSEMLVKAARSRVPIILSRTSPTYLAVELAERLNITIAGYVRADSLIVYSGVFRLK